MLHFLKVTDQNNFLTILIYFVLLLGRCLKITINLFKQTKNLTPPHTATTTPLPPPEKKNKTKKTKKQPPKPTNQTPKTPNQTKSPKTLQKSPKSP